MMPKGVVLAVLLAIATTAPAALAAPPPALAVVPPTAPIAGWSRVETPDFTLLGNVPEARLRVIGARLEAFRATLEWLHPGSRASPRETFVYVFARPEAGQPYAPDSLSGNGHLGKNQPFDIGNYVAIAAPDDDPPLEPLFHAYAHQFLDDGFARLPLFVEEGLAEVYTRFRVVPEGTLIGLAAPDHVAWIRARLPRPLAAEFRLDAPTLRGSLPEVRRGFVADSWALMHYLLTGSGDRRASVPGFLDALQRGIPVDTAARDRLGVDLDGLREAMATYVGGNRFLPLRTTDATVRQDPAAFSARTMPRDEVLAALGDLIAHGGPEHDTDALAYLDESLRLNPQQARAHAALGSLHCARNRPDDAVLSFERAITLAPDAVSCYLLARTLVAKHASELQTSETPAWLRRARALLDQASSLRPGFAAPYVLLGTTHLRPDGDPVAGIAALQKALALLPARTDIAGSLVYLYLRTDDVARARAMLDRVIVPSGDAPTTRQASSAIATWEQHAESKRSVRKAPADKTPPSPKDVEAYARFIQTLRETLPKITDPARRALILAQIHDYEHPPDIDPSRAIEIYNEAIDHANKRDYTQAISLLEGLMKHDIDADFRATIQGMLGKLRQDAARQQQPASQ
jgi:cytochrome c-type biogenesis protein CcmH/NrfG